MDPRQTPVHQAARALDDCARIHRRKEAAIARATERLTAKYGAEMEAVLEALSPEALAMVKAQMGDGARE